ncbi:protein of unknown function [Shewanella benthica]|uniref:Uncharacterized protein n=1 Tax=Shewanella benthica TaxID=43661 RepID=A0A330M751_9GAMM|nr:protein of unknown function [Shewanella benthica]
MCFNFYLHGYLSLAAGLYADASANRRKHFPVGSAKTSLFWKLAAASTPGFHKQPISSI